MMTKSIVITGASKGIGRATALHLAAQGYHVFAGIRNPADGEALQAEVGEWLTPLQIDVTDEGQIATAANQVTATVGDAGLAGLINNAGVAVAAPLEFIAIEELRNQLEINVVGQIAVTQAFLPLLRQARGRIINISSMGGRVAGPLTGPYHASKFALEALTDSLRCELVPWGIEVVGIEPGTIATPIWETSLARAQGMIDTFPPLAHELYGKQMANRIVRAQQSATKGISPSRVAEVIAKALAARRPRTRYLVGTDAKIAGHIVTRLPDRWRDWLILRQG